MAEVRITAKALSDIEAIGEFIGRDSEKYAKTTIQNFYHSIQYLEHFSELGRIVPELNLKSVREIIFGNYRIIYWVISKKRIDVIAVHNSAMRLTKRKIINRRK